MQAGSLSHRLICGILVCVCTIPLKTLLQCFLRNLDWLKARLRAVLIITVTNSPRESELLARTRNGTAALLQRLRLIL